MHLRKSEVPAGTLFEKVRLPVTGKEAISGIAEGLPLVINIPAYWGLGTAPQKMEGKRKWTKPRS